MTCDNLFTHQLSRASNECKSYLIAQFPNLATPEMDFAVAELGEMLKTPSGKKDPEYLVTGWLSKLICGKYGVECQEMMKVSPIPEGMHRFKDPVDEAVELMGQEKVVVLNLEE